MPTRRSLTCLFLVVFSVFCITDASFFGKSIHATSQDSGPEIEALENDRISAQLNIHSIEQAKADLGRISLRDVQKNYTKLRHPIAYVIVNPVTRERRICYATAQNHFTYKKSGKKRKKTLTIKTLVPFDRDVQFAFDRWNWRNTAYTVTVGKEHGWIVLANKFPSYSTSDEHVYVPYSPRLHMATPDLPQEGMAYLDSIYEAALGALMAKPITWKYLMFMGVAEDSRLGRSFLKRLVKSIITIEHIDHDEFRTQDAVWLMDKVLVTIGANKETAFNASVSSAGAGGLAQFINDTYQDVRWRYPEAGLIRNFTDGMLDHVNAMQAMILLLDRDLARLTANPQVSEYLYGPSSASETRLSEEVQFPSVYAMKLWLIASAAYNAGPGEYGEHVGDNIRLRGEDWFRSPVSSLDIIRDEISVLKRKRKRGGLDEADRKNLHRLEADLQHWMQTILSPRKLETYIYLQKSLPAYGFFSESEN